MLTPESSSEIHLFWGDADLLSEPQKSSRQPVPRGSRLFRPNPWTGCRLAIVGSAALPSEISEPLQAAFVRVKRKYSSNSPPPATDLTRAE